MFTTRDNLGFADPVLFEQATRQHRSYRDQLPDTAVRTLASEVISRLSTRFDSTNQPQSKVAVSSLEDFCHALARADDEVCLNMVNAMIADGASVATVYLTYLGGAARLLGTWWEEDKASFAEVTIGTGRIYALLYALRPGLIERNPVYRKRAVFASVPGEQHFLGVTMAADMFRARGWDIDLHTGCEHEELVALVDEVNPAFIGFSGSGQRAVLPLLRLLVAVRAGHPGAYILVSGNVANFDLDMTEVTGADLVTTDIEAAYADMQRLFKRA
ncbi:MAG: B12-binding domain-containing protein [Paracoccaceae bacterium]